MTLNHDEQLQGRLGYCFRDPALLNIALTHSSAVPELRSAAETVGDNPTLIQDNERLEFLGDAVLDLLASEYLVEKFPEWSEGQLSRSRSPDLGLPIASPRAHACLPQDGAGAEACN